MKILSNMAKQVRSLLNIEDISLDPRIGIAMQFAAKYRKDIVFKVHIFQEGHKNFGVLFVFRIAQKFLDLKKCTLFL